MFNMQARADSYKKDESTKDIILHAFPIDEQGKPILEGKDIEVRLSQDAIQKLIREEIPTEEKRIQELLDQIHEIKKNRLKELGTMDERIKELQKDAESKIGGATDKLEVMRYKVLFQTYTQLLSQRRFVAKFTIQEESELSLELAKLRAKSNEG
jgi:hypothetical protein